MLAGVKPFSVSCAQLTPIGTCSHLSNLVTYWLPLYAIEVTGQGGTTIFPGPSSFESVLQQATHPGSMVQGEPDNDTQTKYREAHVYVFSKEDIAETLSGHPCLKCMLLSGHFIGGTVFKSEDNPFVWKTCFDAAGAGNALTQVGAWGPLFPRCGWSNHPSNVVASLLYAYRAQDLASGITRGLSVDRGKIGIDRYEIGGPIPGACYPIGTPAMQLEKLANRPGCADRFIIIYWQYMVKCCPPGTCTK